MAVNEIFAKEAIARAVNRARELGLTKAHDIAVLAIGELKNDGLVIQRKPRHGGSK